MTSNMQLHHCLMFSSPYQRLVSIPSTGQRLWRHQFLKKHQPSHSNPPTIEWLEDLPSEQTSGNGNCGHHRALAKVDPSVLLHKRSFESRAMCPTMQNEPSSTCLWASGTTSRLGATFSLLCRLLPFGTTGALPESWPCSRKAIGYAHEATALEQLDPRSHPCSHNAEGLASGSARASIIHSALTWLVELRDLLELLEGGGAKWALSLAVLRLSLRRNAAGYYNNMQ